MSVIAFVPIRSGSKSIKDKNIKIFNGKPLVWWVLKSLQDCQAIERIIVATDSGMYMKIIEEMNLKKVVIYERSQENAKDTSTTESVMLEYLANNKEKNSDVFVLVQATSPLTTAQDLDKAIALFMTREYDSVLSAVRTKRFIWSGDGCSLNYDFSNRPRRQDFEGSFIENGAFYISTVGGIVKHKNRIGGKIGIFEMDDDSLVEIDEEYDWVELEKLAKKRKKITNIRIVFTDVDGVLTDAGMYYSQNGEELKKFNTRDGMGVGLLKKAGIKTVFITGERSNSVEARAKKLGVHEVYLGVADKKKVIDAYLEKEGISWSNVAYIGDDINDLECLESAGFSACPSDAIAEIKETAMFLANSAGGHGAFREVVDTILAPEKK